MAGFDDVTKKAQEFLADDRVKDALNSEQAEDVSDKLLDGAKDAVNKVTGDKFEQQVDDARDNADKRVGNN
ncbi:antitoxin [Homoserinimonas sp. A447]